LMKSKISASAMIEIKKVVILKFENVWI